MKELLTDKEKKLVKDLGNIANGFSEVAKEEDEGIPYSGDMHEAVLYIHALQNIVLANAAARAYPGKYRLFGKLLTD